MLRRIAMLVVFLFLAPLLAAPERQVAAEGTEVATEETPPAGVNADALRKAVQDPVVNLIRVPLQDDSNFGVGPYDRIQNVLNIQPVVPAHVSENWLLISRMITPIIYQPTVTQPVNQAASGLGEMNPTFFLSPEKPHKITWRARSTFIFTIATNPLFGQGKWSRVPWVLPVSA